MRPSSRTVVSPSDAKARSRETAAIFYEGYHAVTTLLHNEARPKHRGVCRGDVLDTLKNCGKQGLMFR